MWKTSQSLYISNEQVVAVVAAGDEYAVSRSIYGYLAVVVLKFVKLLNTLAARVVGIDWSKSGVVRFKIKLDGV